MKRWQLWVGVVVSAVLLWLALRGLQLQAVWQAVRSARYAWLVPGIAAYMVGVYVRAWRWHYLLRPVKNIPTRRAFPLVAIGYMGNNIYPARAGELLRAYVLRQRESVSISASLATIVAERAFDGIVMLGFVFVTLPQLARMTAASGFAGSIRSLAVSGAVVFALALLAFVLLALFPAPALRLAKSVLQKLGRPELSARVLGWLDHFLTGLQSLRSPVDVGMVLVTSAVIWLLETAKYWFVMQAFPFSVSFFALMLMNGIVNLATTIPSAPGYIGTFDAPGIAVLEAFGVEANLAAGYTLVLHAALWLPITLLGAYFLARESLSWGEVRRQLAQEQS